MSKRLKPEKVVELEVDLWCRRNMWFMSVIDSKATFSQASQCYRKSRSAPEGFPDMVGITPYKDAAYIELKARGKRSTLSEEQAAFLVEVIKMGAFAAVVDSSDGLAEIYQRWIDLGRSKQVLYESLPQTKYIKSLAKAR